MSISSFVPAVRVGDMFDVVATRGARDYAQNGVWLIDLDAGIKEYSEWPTIPQLYVDKEFIGGCDILMTMHQDGSLAKMLEEKGVLVPAKEDPAKEEPK